MLVVSAVLAGCSNVSRFDLPPSLVTGSPTPESIVNRLKCELAILASDKDHWRDFIEVNDFIIGAQIDLAVTDDGSLAPTFTYTSGVFSFNAGARYEISRAQTFTARLFLSITDIRYQLQHHPEALNCPKIDTLLAGDLGVMPTLEMAFRTPDLALTNTKLSGVTGVFGGSVNFMVTKNLNAVGPTYTLTHFKGPGSPAGVSELNNDKITFAFSARSATDKVPAAAKVNAFLDTLLLGQISTQIATNRSQL